ncbi:release factor glutamine methyltransferase [Caloramator quimbayensis]|uniref:Release factor glutamine methyltransferase n=1 Tax=Caloramator quimbayensis TaxID=1147123 RepID=A0A1T4WF21_9CLOT|nr:release factor glutamine methyltransferase [Caloramator quimbayensis]
MKIYEAINKAVQILSNSTSPLLDAQILLESVLEKDRIYIYMNRDKDISDSEVEKFFNLVERRKNGEPISYILGYKEFMSLKFKVEKGVLIPRPDTEVLVEEVLKNIKDKKNPIIVDVGCGSGAISVSIAKYKEDALIYALDIMDVPLKVTFENARLYGVEKRVHVIKSDMLKSLDKTLYDKVDVLVSNPPYIKWDIIPTLMKDVKDYEPYEALYGGEDGLYFYRNITREALPFIKSGGFIAYEIGHDQGFQVQNILKENEFYNICCIKDLAGLDRVVTGWRR